MNPKLILGADVGGTAVKFVLRDLHGKEIQRDDIPTDISDCPATLNRLADRLKELGHEQNICAVGIACAGIVDTNGGLLGRAPNLPGWEGENLKAIAAAIWPGSPIALANDVNGALIAEARDGAGRDCNDIVMLALGTGVGGGVLIDGRLQVGRRFGAGDIGHMVLDPDGNLCTCGNRGCLEAYSGATALIQAARTRAAGDDCGQPLRDAVKADPNGPTPRILADLARAGDIDAIALYRFAGEKLGQAIGNLINILDPDIVIIGGGVAGAGELLLDPARKTASSLVLCEAARTTPVLVAELGSHAAAIGAAIIAGDILSESDGSGA